MIVENLDQLRQRLGVDRTAESIRRLSPGDRTKLLTDLGIMEPTGPVKIVLTRDVGQGIELGPFNQGVVIESKDHTGPYTIYDTASSYPILRLMQPSQINAEGHQGIFQRAFIHPVTVST